MGAMDMDGGTVAEAKGYLFTLSNIKFTFAAVLLERILGLIAPADKILESRESGLIVAIELTSAVHTEITQIK